MTIDSDTHGPGYNSIDVVRGFVQLPVKASTATACVQPCRRHASVGRWNEEMQSVRCMAMRAVVMGCGASLLRIPSRQVTATPSSGVRCLPRVSGPSDIAMMKLTVPPKVPMAIGIANPRCQLTAKKAMIGAVRPPKIAPW